MSKNPIGFWEDTLEQPMEKWLDLIKDLLVVVTGDSAYGKNLHIVLMIKQVALHIQIDDWLSLLYPRLLDLIQILW